jgi:hypothetical protein
MLEKDKSKRPFIVDLFEMFPKAMFSITLPQDKSNFEAFA